MHEAAADDVGVAWLAAMRRGDWAQAWRQTDRIELPRRLAQRSPAFVRQPGQLVWDGTPFEGRTVLVRCEHGLGDTLQFIRFVPLIHSVAREVYLLVQPHLLALLSGAPGLGNVRNAWTDEPPAPHDVEIEVMELAYALRAEIGRIPPPYAHLRHRLPARTPLTVTRSDRLRVGLLWAASEWDTSRSVSLQSMAPLMRETNATFFSLQQGERACETMRAGLPIVELSAHTRTIEAAAAAMLRMDLIITVDGMPAHLAASLGRPTWLLLKHDPDWRWMRDRADSPWYPTMRLFRQPQPGDWEGAIMAAEAALSALDSPP